MRVEMQGFRVVVPSILFCLNNTPPKLFTDQFTVRIQFKAFAVTLLPQNKFFVTNSIAPILCLGMIKVIYI